MFSSSDNALFIITADGSLDSYDCNTGHISSSKRLNPKSFLYKAFDAAGWQAYDMTTFYLNMMRNRKVLAIATNRGIEFRELSNGLIIESHEVEGGCYCVDYETKAGVLAAGRMKGGIDLYNISTSNWTQFVESDRKPRDLAFSPNGEFLATVFWDGIKIFKVEDHRLVFSASGADLKIDISH